MDPIAPQGTSAKVAGMGQQSQILAYGAVPCFRGTLIAIEGVSGVGKTYLTGQLVPHLTNPGHDTEGAAPLVLEEFSQRSSREAPENLGRGLLKALRAAAAPGDRFLRGGYPASETLILLAIKMHDFETSLPALQAGRTVLEGRSLHCLAATQGLILHEDDDLALKEALDLLALAGQWRPLPDLTILITDDLDTAMSRAERRDHYEFPAAERQMHARAERLYEQLAAADPTTVRILDRRLVAEQEAVQQMLGWIQERSSELPCLPRRWRTASAGDAPGAADELCETCRREHRQVAAGHAK